MTTITHDVRPHPLLRSPSEPGKPQTSQQTATPLQSTRQLFNFPLPKPLPHNAAHHHFSSKPDIETEQQLAMDMPWTPEARRFMAQLPVIRSSEDQQRVVNSAYAAALKHARPGRATVLDFCENHDNMNMVGTVKKAIDFAKTPQAAPLKIESFLIELPPGSKQAMANMTQQKLAEIAKTPGGLDAYLRREGCSQSVRRIITSKVPVLLRHAASSGMHVHFIDIDSNDMEKRNQAMVAAIRKYTEGGKGTIVLNGLAHAANMHSMMLRGQAEKDGPQVAPRMNAIFIPVLDSTYPGLTSASVEELKKNPVGDRRITVRVAENMKFRPQ